MHEKLNEDHHIEGSSDRSFGLTVGGILFCVEGYRYYSEPVIDTLALILLCISVPLILFGAIYPSILAPLNKAWTKLGFIMFKVVSPVILFLLYLLTIVPIGLIFKILRKDVLRLKLEKSSSTYWIERDPAGPAPESMKNQF